MGEGRPSVTARRVAACRLGFDRLAASFGDPSADERLAADVAGAETSEPGERMVGYLRTCATAGSPGRSWPAASSPTVGRLHSLAPQPELMMRPGGAWHHLAAGTPVDEITAAVSLLDDAACRVPAGQGAFFDALHAALVRADGCDDLPHALIHPDFVPANARATASGGTVILDWAGAGWGPRLHSLGFLLWAAGRQSPRCLNAAIAGYRPHIELRPQEMDRLAGAILARPLILSSWSFSTGREPPEDVAGRLASSTADATAIAAQARTALGASPRPRTRL